jgi:sialate O-acetylesterase
MRLAGMFSDHMVVQRDRPVPVWGWAPPGTAIRVSLAGAVAEAQTDSKGRFRAVLSPVPAGGPYELVVDGPERTVLHDVHVGEVWVCSGQSNMYWPVWASADADSEIAAAQYPGIRLFTVPDRALPEPAADVAGASWVPCSSESVKEFSAVGYSFGRELHRELGVAIGLIQSAVGGTRIEAWMSREALMREPAAAREVREYEACLASPPAAAECERSRNQPASPRERERMEAVPDPGDTGTAREWADGEFDDSAWPVIRLPQSWQQAGHDFSGVFWFRKTFVLPPEWAGRVLELRLGACDKQDVTCFNGERVGATGWETKDAWSVRRRYILPGRLVRAGRNTIAVRVYSYLYAGGMVGPAEQMWIAPCSKGKEVPIPLDGEWRLQVEHNFGKIAPPILPPGAGNPNTPFILFDGMIRPVAPFAARGVIWYQGESNAERAAQYRALLPLLIRDWRGAWGADDLWFLVAQVSGHGPYQQSPVERHPWADLREAQQAALSLPKTGLAVTCDLGDVFDVHPIRKREVGERLARIALSRAYGMERVDSGPRLRDWRVEGREVRLEFDSSGSGLATSDGKALRGFAMCGPDKVFHWAEGELRGGTARIRAEAVFRPEAVRYAWAGHPIGNLVNGEGLPASPFRTDREREAAPTSGA